MKDIIEPLFQVINTTDKPITQFEISIQTKAAEFFEQKFDGQYIQWGTVKKEECPF